MADLEILALNESTPRIEAAQAGDRYLARRVIVTQLGTITADQPQELSATWNNAGVTFKGRRVVITDTASAAGSLVDEVAVNGSRVYCVRKDGRITGAISGGYLELNHSLSGVAIGRDTVGAALVAGYYATYIVTLHRDAVFGWDGSGSANLSPNTDLELRRDASDTLAQRRGTNAQITRVYRTFTDSSNFERTALQWEGTGNSIASVLRNQAAGTGTLRPFIPVTGGFTVANLPSASTIGLGGRCMVTDSNATHAAGLGNIVAGGGANIVPVYSDGTNWRIG